MKAALETSRKEMCLLFTSAPFTRVCILEYLCLLVLSLSRFLLRDGDSSSQIASSLKVFYLLLMQWDEIFVSSSINYWSFVTKKTLLNHATQSLPLFLCVSFSFSSSSSSSIWFFSSFSLLFIIHLRIQSSNNINRHKQTAFLVCVFSTQRFQPLTATRILSESQCMGATFHPTQRWCCR